VIAGNLAAAPEKLKQRRTAEANLPPQRSLFADRPASKIIPFETRVIASAEADLPQAPPKPAPRKMAERPASKPAAPRPAARKNDRQREFDLLPAAPIAPRTLKTKVEASIYCDAPVATVAHRALAGAVDFSLILIGYVLCITTYYLMGGALPASRLGYMVFAAGFLLIAGLYGLMWALGNGETPGMHWTRLTLTNFDGQEPELGQRLLRYFGTCLSVATCGCGLLWALVDEENLTWQDHMSKTFPTFQRPETSFCKVGQPF
jgi:uncharacterized RDD family membrane protein YckC